MLNFKNYAEASLEFPAKVNSLVGLNGSGKTNLLDAIYYLSFTKSFLNAGDAQHIRHGENSFFIRGSFDLENSKHEVTCQVQHGQKKIFREDGRDYEKIGEHIGKYPVVLISPSDIDIIKESSEARRKFFDGMISQIDSVYLQALLEYQHCLKQRNGLLKMFADRGNADLDLLDTYDRQLVRSGKLIFEKRSEFVLEFAPLLNISFAFLVKDQEEAELHYRSQLGENDFLTMLKKSYEKDLLLQRTTVGIHRDDFDFEFQHGELRKLGSQGQQKSFLVALRLANLEVIKKHKGFSPILLLDDIFDKLDDLRIARLLQLVTDQNHGQVFITDAGPERTKSLLRQLQVHSDIFEVDKGLIQHAS